MFLDDTIVAISSPPGSSVRGIVRLSGDDAFTIADQVFSATDVPTIAHVAGKCRLPGLLRLTNRTLPAAAWVFPAPRSYTRQHIVEFHLLGSPVILGMLVEACINAGARRAEPGEFTARAFLAGALDLSQVHGIAGMIAAQSDLQLEAAGRLLHGALSQTAQTAREELADLLSLVEGALDFADEPIEFITPHELHRRLMAVSASLESTLGAAVRVQRWGELPRVVLLGPPNVGKSSLFNRLTGLDRAICTPVAGTTRDTLSAPLSLGEMECLLLDIPGLEPPLPVAEGRGEGHTPSPSKGEGRGESPTTSGAPGELDHRIQRAAVESLRSADLALLVIDASNDSTWNFAPPPALGSSVPRLRVANKIDQIPPGTHAAFAQRLPAAEHVVLTSASTGDGCDALLKSIAARLRDKPLDIRDTAIALMAEHRQALLDSLDALTRATDLCPPEKSNLEDADLVAAELRAAADSLAALVGQEDTEDLLGRIFSRFCVGK